MQCSPLSGRSLATALNSFHRYGGRSVHEYSPKTQYISTKSYKTSRRFSLRLCHYYITIISCNTRIVGVLDYMLTVEDTMKKFVGVCLASPHAFY